MRDGGTSLAAASHSSFMACSAAPSESKKTRALQRQTAAALAAAAGAAWAGLGMSGAALARMQRTYRLAPPGACSKTTLLMWGSFAKRPNTSAGLSLRNQGCE